MTYFIKSGATYNVTATASVDLHQELPAGTYTIKFNEMAGAYYLEEIDNFEIKGKLYGDTTKNAARILGTFNQRDNSTGVMLTGEKGSGKTLLAKTISVRAREAGMPTIVINQPWCGEVFNGFLQLIDQPTVVIFDEFEKVYKTEEQEKLLTLFDGVYPSKKLFIITSNDKNRVNEHMQNRPGRIFYRIEYKGLDNDFILEYCRDNLLNVSHTDALCRLATLFGEFNFDILKAMVEEMNRYDESPQEAMKMLNAKPELGDGARFTVSLRIADGGPVSAKDTHPTTWRGNPFRDTVDVSHYVKNTLNDDDSDWVTLAFSSKELATVSAAAGEFTFMNAAGDTLLLTKQKVFEHNWDAF